MKKIARLMGVCLLALVFVSITSCGSKVNKEELDEKIENSFKSDKKPEFTQEEYQFMADYLLDNFDELEKADLNSKEADRAISYMMILAFAEEEGLLDKETKKKTDLLNEKVRGTKDFQEYEANEKALLDALEEGDIDWDEAYESSEAEIAEEYATAAEEYATAIEE